MGFSYTFIHTDINQRIPENWALRELYWKHSEIKGDVLENPKNKVWSSFTFECRKIPIMDKRAYGPQPANAEHWHHCDDLHISESVEGGF